jgi:hypothetical protein
LHVARQENPHQILPFISVFSSLANHVVLLILLRIAKGRRCSTLRFKGPSFTNYNLLCNISIFVAHRTVRVEHYPYPFFPIGQSALDVFGLLQVAKRATLHRPGTHLDLDLAYDQSTFGPGFSLYIACIRKYRRRGHGWPISPHH